MRHLYLLVVAVIAVLLPVPVVAQTAPAPTITPEISINESVQQGEWLTIAGQAPSGGTIDSASLLGFRQGTQVVQQPINSLNAAPSNNQTSYVRIVGESFEGRAQLGCLFAPDTELCPGTHQTPDEVRLRVVVAGASVVSGPVPVDFTAPQIVRYDVTSPTQIVVVFSERVRLQANGSIFPAQDSASDFSAVDPSISIFQVESRTADCPDGRTGCTRVLTTSTIPEDATPEVFYNPLFNRPVYTDHGGNIIRREDGAGARQDAIDRVIPAAPQIDQVAGRTPSSGVVSWREPAPALALSNLTVGQQLYVAVDGARVAGPVDVTATSQTISVPSLGGDRDGIRLTVIARDPAGNCSQSQVQLAACSGSAEGSPPRQNGANNPVTYNLDTLAPFVGSVTRPNETTLTVTFNEAVTPSNGAGRFTVNGVAPSSVTGEGAVRTLTFAQPIDGTDLSWAADPNAYVDRVQLALAPFSRPITVPPAPPAPQITIPATRRVINATTVELRGTVQGTSTTRVVELYTDPQAPQSSRVGSDYTVTNGQWTAPDAPLPSGANATRTFYARTRDTSTQVRSALPASPSVEIVKDTVAPTVDITSPSTSILGGGPDPVGRNEEVVVEWTASDANPASFQLTLTDAAGTTVDCEEPVFTREQTSYSGTCMVPDTFVGGNATIRLAASDLTRAPENTEAQKNPETIEVFDQLPIDPDRIAAVGDLTSNQLGNVVLTLDYGVELSGSTNGGDWRANDGRNAGTPNRAPFNASRSGSVVTLSGFAQTFPGGVAGPHPNARPAYTYAPGIGQGAGLTASEGRTIATSGRVRDITPPRLTGVPADYGTLNGTAQRAQIASCADGAPADAMPRCPAGPVLALRGQTDTAFAYGDSTPRVNSVRVYAGVVDFTDPAARAAAQPIADAAVADDGTFVAAVGLAPNRPQQFTVLATDIHGSQGQAPVQQVVSVVEDSLGPVITSLRAQLVTSEDEPLILVPATFDQVVDTLSLEYQLGTGGFQPLDTIVPSADRATYRWTPLPFELDQLADGLQIRATATDPLGNEGPSRITGLSNLPRITTAAVLDEDTVTVTTTEAVTTERGDAAGFSIGGGPGVLSTSVSGTTITLALADPLEAGDFTVRYNGQGAWATSDERPLAAGTAPLTLSDEILFPVTGLAAGPTETGAVVSFVDERNDVDRVTGYEVSRNGTITDTLDADERILLDPDLDAGSYTYTVTVLGQDGLRSDPRSVLVQLGPSPVDEESREEAIGGGTGFPVGSEIIDDCPFPAAPNIGTNGGIVLSCDGRVAALVPAGVSSGPAYGAILRRTTVPTEGFDDVTDLYQLIAVEAAPGFPVVDDFDGFVELSFRALAPTLADTVTERVTTLRPFDGAPFDEKAARVGSESVATQLITVGSFGVVEADGASVRVFGPDPAVPADRFATAVSLSQTQYRTSTFAVLARADDYPDALAASPLAAQLGAPVLLSRSSDVPFTTLAELARLQTEVVYLVGGTAALSPDVQAQLEATGREVIRLAGPSRFDTAAAVARVVGSVDGSAFIATGATFADALAAAAPAAAIGRPILLAQADGLPAATRTALDDIRAVAIHLVGGEQAIAASVATDAAAEGFSVVRSSGATRYATAVALAQSLVDDGLLGVRQPVLASGEGDGRTSPDALAAGPISGRIRGVLLLTPRDGLPEEVAGFLSGSSVLRGLYLAGGEAAVTSGGRAAIDAAAGPPGAD